MKLEGLKRIFMPRHLMGKLLLFCVLPVAVFIAAALHLFAVSEISMLRDGINESLSFHTQAVASALGRRFGACETVLRSFAARPDVRALLLSPRVRDYNAAVSILGTLKAEASCVFPAALGVFITAADQVVLVPPPPESSDLSAPGSARKLLTYASKPGFSWSRPLKWSPGRSVVTAQWNLKRPDGSPAALGIVLSLERIASGIGEMNLLLTDALGLLVVQRSSGVCWFVRPARPPAESAPGFPLEGAFLGQLVDSLSESMVSGRRFGLPGGDALLFSAPLASGDLCLGVLYDAERLDAPIAVQRLTAVLMAIFLFLSFAVLIALMYRTLGSGLAELADALETFRLYNEVPEPPPGVALEILRVWDELRNLAEESRKRASMTADSTSAYRSLLVKNRELIELMQDGYLLADDSERIVECNSSLCVLSGRRDEEILKMKVSDLLEFGSGGARIVRPDGMFVPVSVGRRRVSLGYKDYDILILRDTTKEEELRNSLLKLSDDYERQKLEVKTQVRDHRLAIKTLVDRLLEAVLRVDNAGNVLDCNPAAVRLFRYPARDDLIGVNLFSHLNFSDRSRPGTRDFLDGAALPGPVEVSFTTFEGTAGHALVSCWWVDDRKRDMAELLLADLSESVELRNALEALRRETEVILRGHEDELKRTQQQLIDHAHRAGMAVVASEILHNIGNAINSIGVRLKEVAEILSREKITERLKLLTEMCSSSQSVSGETLRRYVNMLVKTVSESRARLREDVDFISEKLSHISEIIMLQQSVASIRGIIEEVKVTDLILDSVEMNREVMEKRGISVSFRFADVPPVKVEKNKLLQVLVNLIKNAIEAIDMAGDSARKEIIVEVTPAPDGKNVRISVTDSGVGMTREVLSRLFSFGFTTKHDRGGSGFGLHSSSNLLKTMGGSIRARSDGPGKGSTFTVTIPLEPPVDGSAS